MTRSTTLILALLLSTGCIFGTGGDPNSNDGPNNTANQRTNNGTTAGDTNNGTATGSNNSTTATNNGTTSSTTNGMTTAETFLKLDADSVECPVPKTLWFSPAMQPAISPGSGVATGPPPTDQRDGVLGGEAVGDVSIAYATPTASAVEVYAAAAAIDPDTQELEPLMEGSSTIDVSGVEVYSMLLVSEGFEPKEGEPGTVLTTTLSTSAGVYDCHLTVDVADETDFTCVTSLYDSVLGENGLNAPSRVDLAPVFSEHTTEDGFEWGYDVLSSDYVLTASQPLDGGGERLGVLLTDAEGANVRSVAFSEALNAETDSTFAERVLLGVPAESFGYPFIAALAPGTRPQPVVLRANTPDGTEYTAATEYDDWEMSARLDPGPENFTFVDHYVAQMRWSLSQPTGLRIEPGTLNLGYVGLDESGLVFSRPGGFGGADFLEFGLEEAVEIAAFKNLAIQTGDGPSAIAVIHGGDRDKVAVFRWNVGLDADWVEDILADGFTQAQGMNTVWFLDDAGTIPFVAEREGTWVLAAIDVPNLRDLSEGCN